MSAAITAFRVRRELPPASIILAEVDLNNPGVEIILNPLPFTKRLTSEFAKEYDCDLAINGEAGLTPGFNSGFGHWLGPYFVKGKQIFFETKYNRPVINFSIMKKATYIPSSQVSRIQPEQMYDALWGRFDILLQGALQNASDERTNPRTAIGLSKERDKLFLLVADGRNPQHSMGLSYRETATILSSFGAWDSMACDQGGSSTMVIKKFGGVANQPSDGSERPVYTHLCLRAYPAVKSTPPNFSDTSLFFGGK